METNLCGTCKRDRPKEEFWSDNFKKYMRTCERCRQHRATWNAQKRVKTQSSRPETLRLRYGISEQDYDRLRERQQHRCAICRRHEEEISVVRSGRPCKDGQLKAESIKLVVDHCHDSLGVRGLLCHKCNAALGLLGESEEVIAAALAYIQADRGRRI